MTIKVMCKYIEEYESNGEIKYTATLAGEDSELTVNKLLNKKFEVGKSYFINILE